MNETIETMMSRLSIRNYTQEKMPEDILHSIVVSWLEKTGLNRR